jgi:chaperone modulatory protein CbpM
MRDDDVLMGALLDEACLTLEQLSVACAVSPDWVAEHVRAGLLHAPDEAQAGWRFSSRDLWRAREIRRLERDFDAVPELAALVVDLLEELDTVRAQLRRGGFA